jgi:hypothetical protein
MLFEQSVKLDQVRFVVNQQLLQLLYVVLGQRIEFIAEFFLQVAERNFHGST